MKKGTQLSLNDVTFHHQQSGLNKQTNLDLGLTSFESDLFLTHMCHVMMKNEKTLPSVKWEYEFDYDESSIAIVRLFIKNFSYTRVSEIMGLFDDVEQFEFEIFQLRRIFLNVLTLMEGLLCFGSLTNDQKMVIGQSEIDKINASIRHAGDEKQSSSSNDNVIKHGALCKELNNLYERKNHDYGDSFHKTFLEEGFAMARIRLSDKLERFKSLTKNGDAKVKDESIRDTLIDLANYALMTIMEIDNDG